MEILYNLDRLRSVGTTLTDVVSYYLLPSEASWPQCCSLAAEFRRHALFCGTAITPQKWAFPKGRYLKRYRPAWPARRRFAFASPR